MLDANHTVVLFRKMAGRVDDELSINAMQVILATLRCRAARYASRSTSQSPATGIHCH